MYSLIASPTGLGYTDTSLTNGLPYWYKVSAVNAVGEGEKTALRLAIPFTVPNAPTGLVAAVGNAQASLNWTAPTFNGGRTIDYYLIYQDGIALPGHPTGITMVITGLSNESYSFTVTAHNSAGNSTQSASASIRPYTVPDAPTLVSAVPSITDVVLTWSANGNGSSPITGYKLYRAESEDGTFTLITSLPGLTYTDTSLTGPHTYWYKVSAVNAAGESANSTAISTLVPMPADAIDNTMLILVAAVILIGAALVVAIVLIRRVRK
jgi:predicted phage tail protein